MPTGGRYGYRTLAPMLRHLENKGLIDSWRAVAMPKGMPHYDVLTKPEPGLVPFRMTPQETRGFILALNAYSKDIERGRADAAFTRNVEQGRPFKHEPDCLALVNGEMCLCAKGVSPAS